MNASEVLQLINAGFTREEILNLESGNPQINPTPAPTEKAEPVTTPEPIIDNPNPTPEVVAAPMVSDAQIEKLAQLINVGKSTIDLPPQRSLDDLMSKHFSELMLGQ